MSRPERVRRMYARVGAAITLCAALASAGTEARASSMLMLETRAASESTRVAPAIPMISNGRPCALCFIAPGLSPQAFTGAGRNPPPPTGCLPAPPTSTRLRFMALETRPDRVPRRIVLCRWLD